MAKDIYIFDTTNKDYTYDLEEDTNIYHYVINSSSNIIINLNKENIKLNYYYSNINYDDNTYNISIKHNVSNTYSNVYNHSVNVLNNKLKYRVDGIIPKSSNKCICNQDNEIINLKDGLSTIWPNLLIDNYDVDSSHSAYIGKFKEEMLFYLESRGISKKSSYSLLIKGFLVQNLNNKNNDLFIKEIDKI
jgi:Fe-S cluster assembly protein SufD